MKPDAIPIVVLQPFGPVRFLFEIGDTEGREIPGERMNSLFADGCVPQALYDRTKAAAARYGVEVVEADNYGALLAGTAAALQQLPETLQQKSMSAPRYRVSPGLTVGRGLKPFAQDGSGLQCAYRPASRSGAD